MGKLVSGRVKRKSQTGITSDRYQFLGLEQAEPNLGDPTVGPSSTGVNPVKIGTVYQLVSVDQNPGERFWTPISGIGTSVGAITVYNNGNIATPNFFNTIHGLNFVGAGVSVIAPGVAGPFPGVGIATIDIGFIELQNQGEENQILYNSPTGNAVGAPDFYYVSGNVGIGSSSPKAKLDVNGNVIISGVVTANTFFGNFEGTVSYATSSGFSTTSTYSLNSGVSTNVIGGIASVTQLSVTGVSTLGIITANSGFIKTLSGENAVFSGIVTAQFIDGTFIGEVEASKTAENVIGGIASVTQLNVTGVSTLPIINGGNANFSGIVTAAAFNGTATSALYANVAGFASFTGVSDYAAVAGVATYAFVSGIATYAAVAGIATYANISGISTNVIGGIGSLTQLTVSGISTLSDIRIGAGIITSAGPGIVTYYGDGSKLLGVDIGRLPDEYTYVYVDGTVTLGGDGLAQYASIPNAIWTDIKANIVRHEISTWVGTAPSEGSFQAQLASRVVFPNMKLAFDSFANRIPETVTDLRVYLYSTSDSNVGLAGSSVSQCFYGGSTQLTVLRGPSRSLLSGKPWINEHYSGVIRVPFTKVTFDRVNLNCSGITTDSERYGNNGTFIQAPSVAITNSRFKLNSNGTNAGGFIIATGVDSVTDSNEGGNVQISRTDNVISEIEFNTDILQPNQSNQVVRSLAISTGKLTLNARTSIENPLKITYNLKKTLLPGFLNNVSGDFFCEIGDYDGADLILTSGNPVTGAYANVDFVFDFTGSNARGRFTWLTTTFQGNNIVIRDTNNLYTPNRSLLNTSIVGIGSYTSFSALTATNPINLNARTRDSIDPQLVDNNNLLSKMQVAFTTTGISTANSFAWRLPAGSYRDGQLGVGTILINTPDIV
jgi:hypothetical protein